MDPLAVCVYGADKSPAPSRYDTILVTSRYMTSALVNSCHSFLSLALLLCSVPQTFLFAAELLINLDAFSVLTPFIGRKEEHPACEQTGVVICLEPGGPADATAAPSSLAPYRIVS